MKKTLIQKKGITLIALVVTIIVLLLLAGISVMMLTGNNGILQRAGEAKEKTDEAQIEERIKLAYHSALVDGQGRVIENILNTELTKEFGENGYMLDTSNTSLWKVTVNGVDVDIPAGTITGNTEVPDLLKDYILGQTVNGVRPGKELTSILSFQSFAFIDDPNTIEHASTEVVALNFAHVENTLNVYAKYNNVAYRIIVNVNIDNEVYITSDLVKVYEPDANSNVGKVVQYSVDGESTARDWLVLYDNGSTIDITPVDITVADVEKENKPWTYILGPNDPKAIETLPSGTDFERTQNSYENAVSRLNTYCETLVTNVTAQKVRSVGTQFDIADTSTYYSSDFLANNPISDPGRYNYVVNSEETRYPGKIGDMNEEQDVVRMSYYSSGGTGSGYHTFGYAATSNDYWLASREVMLIKEYESASSWHLFTGFCVKCTDRGMITNNNLWGVSQSGILCVTPNRTAVRPVVRVSVNDVSGI